MVFISAMQSPKPFLVWGALPACVINHSRAAQMSINQLRRGSRRLGGPEQTPRIEVSGNRWVLWFYLGMSIVLSRVQLSPMCGVWKVSHRNRDRFHGECLANQGKSLQLHLWGVRESVQTSAGYQSNQQFRQQRGEQTNAPTRRGKLSE